MFICAWAHNWPVPVPLLPGLGYIRVMVALPQSVQEVADVIGTERALFLVSQLPQCGKRSRRRFLYVPKKRRLTDDHQLVQIVGWDAARALVAHFGGATLELATCRDITLAWQNRCIEDRWARGYTSEQAWAELTGDGAEPWIAKSSMKKKFAELDRIERERKTRQRDLGSAREMVPEKGRNHDARKLRCGRGKGIVGAD